MMNKTYLLSFFPLMGGPYTLPYNIDGTLQPHEDIYLHQSQLVWHRFMQFAEFGISTTRAEHSKV